MSGAHSFIDLSGVFSNHLTTVMFDNCYDDGVLFEREPNNNVNLLSDHFWILVIFQNKEQQMIPNFNNKEI